MSKYVKSAEEAIKASRAAESKGNKHVFILMDESGSMGGLEEAVTTGCNEFIFEFKDEPDVRIWLAWFDKSPARPRTRFKVKGKTAAEVEQLAPGDYRPCGMTPLNDAIADSVAALDAATSEDDVVFLAIFTDGRENASEHSTESIKQLLERREKAGWGIVFVGANQNTVETAAKFGMRKGGRAFNFDADRESIRSTMEMTSYLMRMRFEKEAGLLGLSEYDKEVAIEHARRQGRLDGRPGRPSKPS